ncbi:MAG: hypothetical protein QXP36_07900 [Conexivisphaerales archaeon]
MPRKEKERIRYRHYRRARRTRKIKEVGLVPAIIGGMAAAVPFVASDNEGTNFIGNVAAGLQGDSSVWQYVGEDLIQSTKNNLGDIIALGALAGIFGYVGKKVHIPLTKHLKLF